MTFRKRVGCGHSPLRIHSPGGYAMEIVLMILLFLTPCFSILLVLIQRGRGGGLAGAFGGMGGQSAFGTKAGDLFTRITIGVAAALDYAAAPVAVKISSARSDQHLRLTRRCRPGRAIKARPSSTAKAAPARQQTGARLNRHPVRPIRSTATDWRSGRGRRDRRANGRPHRAQARRRLRAPAAPAGKKQAPQSTRPRVTRQSACDARAACCVACLPEN